MKDKHLKTRIIGYAFLVISVVIFTLAQYANQEIYAKLEAAYFTVCAATLLFYYAFSTKEGEFYLRGFLISKKNKPQHYRCLQLATLCSAITLFILGMLRF